MANKYELLEFLELDAQEHNMTRKRRRRLELRERCYPFTLDYENFKNMYRLIKSLTRDLCDELRLLMKYRGRSTDLSVETKQSGKEMPLSPVPAAAVTAATAAADRDELLGSLTTQQQQRTSARVIKKLRLDDAAADKKDTPDCDSTPKLKEEEKETLKLSTVKPRMPKAIWLTDEKNLFFEALNEFGKDFDAITTYICAKMKKKGVSDAMLKTKSQVSHFYYRTWHKLSKHVHFDENVKKVAQELYALINYGELRKKLISVPEKTCARLGAMVASGGLVVRARGRSLRVRTPMCRALRDLNQITERSLGTRVCSRCAVWVRARSTAGWARALAAACNPRLALDLPLRTRLDHLLAALERRFAGWRDPDENRKLNGIAEKPEDQDDCQDSNLRPTENGKEEKLDFENHLNLETERMIVEERNLPKKLALHLGPNPNTTIHIPILTASEHLSSQKICFASYLERMCKDKDQPKIRTPKRQRKDSATEKDKELEAKKVKLDDSEPKQRIDIDETAIDGIELMANIKNNQEDEEKYDKLTEDEKETKIDELTEEERDGQTERDKEMSEKEKDSFSDMDDEEKYTKSDTDNESDGKVEKNGKERKFKNLKVKFRIRPKKRGGSIYTLVTDDAKEHIEDPVKTPEDQVKGLDDQAKGVEDQKLLEEHKDEEKPDIDVEFVTKQIRSGWSVYDAGQLTIGDLYLMFGSRSKIELDYWWAEPSMPLPQISQKQQPKTTDVDKSPPLEKDKAIEKKEKVDKTPEKGTDSSLEDDKEKRESDTDIFSPKNTFNQDSNDGMSGDERKNEQLLSPEQKCGSLRLANKLVNRPDRAETNNQRHLAIINDRLKRLLSMAGNPHFASTSISGKCNCGHVCPKKRTCDKPQSHAPLQVVQNNVTATQRALDEANAQVFRHPTPIAPKPHDGRPPPVMSRIESSHRGRGRPRAERRVVVQRLLPLLPKLPPAHNLIPVKLVPNMPPMLPKILPRPAPPPNNSNDSSLSNVYVLSEMNGRFFFHDGDRRVPITLSPPASPSVSNDCKSNILSEVDQKEEYILMDSPPATAPTSPPAVPHAHVTLTLQKEEQKPDIANFLPSESMSLSPSRLLRDTEGAWLDSSVQDFSLSSFLGHLEGRAPPNVDSQLQSLMAESSVDYVAKFADLAAEVTDEPDPLAD